jgi:hypothetical protein
VGNIRLMELPLEIAEHRVGQAEIPRIRAWIEQTRALSAQGLVRPDIGELAELFVAVLLDGTRARRGERGWDVRVGDQPRYFQVKSVWHLPHRRRQNLGRITRDFAGDIFVVEFARNLSIQQVRTLPGALFTGKRLRVSEARAERWSGNGNAPHSN